jgi:palmitoyltransferase
MYTWFFCAVVLGAAGSTLRKQLDAGSTLDGFLVAVLVLSGFFGLFTFLMTITSWRYIFTNLTNVDMIGARRKVYQLAVRIPRGSAPTDKYHTVTYPLPRPATLTNGQPGGPAQLDGGRDGIAARTFAIVKTEPGENPWNLGLWENWKEVMGSNPLDWFLPIKRSPCVNHDSQESYYRMGPVLDKIRAEYGIGGLSADEADMLELRNLGRNTT